jgi:OmpA-OmpF porin, OOP family
MVYGEFMITKHSKTLILSAAIAAVFSGAAIADDHKFEAQATVGGIAFDDPLEDSSTWGLGLGYVLNQNWTLEAIASKYDTETTDGGLDLDGSQYRLDMVYNVITESQWRPFVVFGLGDQKRELNAAGGSSERDTLLNLGVGVKHSLGENWEFRSDIRAFNSLDNEYTDVAVNAGIAYLFGKTSAPVKAAAPAPVTKEIDSDGDGVFDSKDQCPDTAKQYKVDAVGCPMELTETVSIALAVKFDSAKSVVKDEFVSDIKKLADFMNQYANTVVTVEGHTDSQGSEAYNQKLSQSRAEAVKATLITKFGIEADRVKAVGFGEAQPVADNMTAQGRETNRRVVGAVSTDVTKKQIRK